MLTAVDRFTRLQAFPVFDIRAAAVATVFVNGQRFGSPSIVATERGRQFKYALFDAFVKVLGSRQIHTIAYHPSAKDLVEFMRRQLKIFLVT